MPLPLMRVKYEMSRGLAGNAQDRGLKYGSRSNTKLAFHLILPQPVFCLLNVSKFFIHSCQKQLSFQRVISIQPTDRTSQISWGHACSTAHYPEDSLLLRGWRHIPGRLGRQAPPLCIVPQQHPQQASCDILAIHEHLQCAILLQVADFKIEHLKIAPPTTADTFHGRNFGAGVNIPVPSMKCNPSSRQLSCL